jgi:hypothetical protein
MNDDDDYIVSIDSFNNKGYKDDDDFETWMKHEAPFVDATTGTLAEGSSSYNYDTTISFTTGNSIVYKQKKLPIDILYKWYPKEMKEIDD